MMEQYLFPNFQIKKQSDQEKVVAVIHRHWFDILSHLLFVFVIVALLILSIVFSSSIFPFFAQNPALSSLLLFIENLFFIGIWIFGFIIWIDYFFDVWIITTERVIDINQRGLFVRSVSELNIGKIQDITTEVEGLIPTVLNYGDIHVQTAGEKERFIFRQVPDPYRVKTMIMNMQKKEGLHP